MGPLYALHSYMSDASLSCCFFVNYLMEFHAMCLLAWFKFTLIKLNMNAYRRAVRIIKNKENENDMIAIVINGHLHKPDISLKWTPGVGFVPAFYQSFYCN